jgi:signal transduction histidine kinase
LILGSITLVGGLPLEFALVVGILLALLSLFMPRLYRTVQRWVDTVLYGCHYDFATVTASFSNRLAQAADREALVHLLKQDLAEQMGIRQSALFLLEEGGVLKLQPTDEEPSVISADDALCQLLLTRGEPVRAASLWEVLSPSAQELWKRFRWGQLFVPLVFEGRMQGVLVLGSRHTGDMYSDGDVRIIGTVAQQGALAYTNVQLVETLRGLNRQLVRTDEAHRKRVTRDLHDTVLQHLFFVKQGLYQERDRGELTDLLEETIQSLRQTIHDQRPPLLEQGVWLALRGLVDEMREVAGPDIKMVWYSNVTERLSLAEEQATALYRIAQEALTNTVKHSGAKNITVVLEREAGGVIRLSITDDGVGMPLVAPGERDHHYGLAGMRERAAMIDARLSIASTQGEGTRVTVELDG